MNPNKQQIIDEVFGGPAPVSNPSIDAGKSRVSELKALRQEAQKNERMSNRSITEKILDFTGGKEIAQGLGQALAQKGNAQKIEQVQNSQFDTQTQLLQRIREKKARGEDTTKLQHALEILNEDITTTGNTAEQILNPNGLTNRDVIGDAVQLAGTTALGAKTPTFESKVANIAARSGVNAGTGYLFDVGEGLQDNKQTIGEALTPGLGTAIGAVSPAVAPVTKGIGRLTSKAGSKLSESVIPNSAKEAKILQAYKAEKPFLQRVSDVLSGTEKAPQTAGKTAVTTTAGQTIPGLFGTKSQIGVQAKRAANSLWENVISPRLDASKKAVDLDGFFAKVKQDIIKKNPELSRQNSLLEALDAVKEDYAGQKAVSLKDLQKLKEGWAKFVPDKAYNGKPIAGAFNDVRNQLADEARQTIYNQLGPDVKQAYFDYGNLKGLQEYGQKAMTGEKLKGGAGSFVSEILSQAVTPIATVGGQTVYRVGKGIEFIGKINAKTVKDALGIKI